MEALFANGRIVDVAIVILALEAVMLSKRGPGAFAGIVANAAAGLFLLLALRFALTDATWMAVAACLALGGLAHAADVFLRLTSKDPHGGRTS